MRILQTKDCTWKNFFKSGCFAFILGFKRKNKKEWAGRERERGRSLIFIRIDIENDSKWNYIKFLITFDEKILDP